MQAVNQFFFSILEFFSGPQQIQKIVRRNIEIAPKSSFAYCSQGKNINSLRNSIKNVAVKIPKHLNKLPRQVGDEFNYMLEICEFLLYTRFFSPKVLK